MSKGCGVALIGKCTQVSLDMYRCLEDVGCDRDKVRNMLDEAAQQFGMDELARHLADNDQGDDYVFVMLCWNGHMFLHVFPSYGYVEADIFSLETAVDAEQLAIYLRKQFGPDQSKMTMLNRGDFGSIADMKPRRKKLVKPIRRAKNAGATLKKFLNQSNSKD